MCMFHHTEYTIEVYKIMKHNDKITQTAFEEDALDKVMKFVAVVVLLAIGGFIIFGFLNI